MKVSTKVLTAVLVLFLAGLLAIHLLILRNVNAESSIREAALGDQVTAMAKQLDDLVTRNRTLSLKLGLAGIRVETMRNNFGTAGDMAESFLRTLAAGGCTKMDQLYPVFDALKENLAGKRDEAALRNLDQINGILFE